MLQKCQYLVHWKGYTHDDDTLEPYENVYETEAYTTYLKKMTPGLKKTNPMSSFISPTNVASRFNMPPQPNYFPHQSSTTDSFITPPSNSSIQSSSNSHQQRNIMSGNIDYTPNKSPTGPIIIHRPPQKKKGKVLS